MTVDEQPLVDCLVEPRIVGSILTRLHRGTGHVQDAGHPDELPPEIAQDLGRRVLLLTTVKRRPSSPSSTRWISGSTSARWAFWKSSGKSTGVKFGSSGVRLKVSRRYALPPTGWPAIARLDIY